MNIVRALWMSVLIYIMAFILGSVVGSLLGFDFSGTAELPTLLWIIGIVLSIIIMSLFALWYFKGAKTVASAKNGFLFGLVAVIVGFALDLILIVPFAPFEQLVRYYTNPWFWATLVVLIATSTIVGKIFEQKKSSHSSFTPSNAGL